MSDRPTSEQVVGQATVQDRELEITRITWSDSPGLSYDVWDRKTGDCLTEDGSLDDYPTDEQLLTLVGHRFCSRCGADLRDGEEERRLHEIDCAEQSGEVPMFERIAGEQGWNPDTMLGLVMEFISQRQLNEELGAFARERADEENRAAAEVTWP